MKVKSIEATQKTDLTIEKFLWASKLDNERTSEMNDWTFKACVKENRITYLYCMRNLICNCNYQISKANW